MIRMKKTKINKWLAIAVFYVIAVIVRALVFSCESVLLGHGALPSDNTFAFWIWGWLEGLGPCLGALVAVLVFKRRFYCTFHGRSFVKSGITVAFPLVLCLLFDWRLCLPLLGFIVYSLLEEMGWRGYLQGELMDMNNTLRIFVIATMWFLWHLDLTFDWGSLIFYGLLLLGSWGIGIMARDTRSLLVCACFHMLFNFSKRGYFEFTPGVIAVYVGVIVLWIAVWYVPWEKLFRRLYVK